LGKLEMRIVAEGSFNMDGVKFDLAAERKRLEEWLQGGGKDLLLMNPRNIEQFHSRAPAQGGPLAGAANLQWFVRRIEPSLKNPKFWSTSYAQGSSELAQATVTVFDHNSPDEWNGGQVPAALLRGKARPCLLELVAINMKERHFQGSDLVSAHAAISPDGSPSIGYKMRDDRCADYANWSQQYIKHHAAILLEDTIRSAPVFQSRIPGSGEIHGDFTKAEVDEQVRVLNAGCLRVTPHYVGQEPAGKNAHR
ncbi:MAG TPA: hypothetical protein VK348_15530, partial [Planctomycetota bacterium]|nr:hypothetical protein [Planctomycetota bacterium]